MIPLKVRCLLFLCVFATYSKLDPGYPGHMHMSPGGLSKLASCHAIWHLHKTGLTQGKELVVCLCVCLLGCVYSDILVCLFVHTNVTCECFVLVASNTKKGILGGVEGRVCLLEGILKRSHKQKYKKVPQVEVHKTCFNLRCVCTY